jgi:hypothetical protein
MANERAQLCGTRKQLEEKERTLKEELRRLSSPQFIPLS